MARRRKKRTQSPQPPPEPRIKRQVLIGTLSGLAALAAGLIVTDLYNSGKDLVKSTQSPLNVNVRKGRLCASYYFNMPPNQLTAAPVPKVIGHSFDASKLAQWAATHDGAETTSTQADLTLGTSGTEAVTITGFRVEVLDRKPPPQGGTVLGSGCGGTLKARTLRVDLDQDPPQLVAEQLEDPNLRSEEVKFPYRVTRTDTELFLLSASTESCYCTWQGWIDWSTATASGSQKIDYEGKPFRTIVERDNDSLSFMYNDNGKWSDA